MFLVVSLKSKLVLRMLKILSCHVKVTLNSITSVEANIIKGLRLDTPPLPRPQKIFKRLQEIYIKPPPKKLMMPMSKAVQLQIQSQWTRWLNYIQQDFSWVSLMAMPANLTFFFLASTFDTLPPLTNLKRCRMTTEAMSTLCSKDMCIMHTI